MLNEMKAFFEGSPLAQRAAESIRSGREIALEVKIGESVDVFTFAKEKDRNILRQGAPTSPDLVFTLPETAAKELVTKQFDTVGQVGLHIFEKMLSNDPSQRIQVKVKAGVLSLVTGGYFGVLTAGGSEVAKFLGSKGLGSLGKLKETISKLKS